MNFTVKQTFPSDKILFQSNMETEAIDYLDQKILEGGGWYELWEEGHGVPLQAGGEKYLSAVDPSRWDIFRLLGNLKKGVNPRK